MENVAAAEKVAEQLLHSLLSWVYLRQPLVTSHRKNVSKRLHSTVFVGKYDRRRYAIFMGFLVRHQSTSTAATSAATRTLPLNTSPFLRPFVLFSMLSVPSMLFVRTEGRAAFVPFHRAIIALSLHILLFFSSFTDFLPLRKLFSAC